MQIRPVKQISTILKKQYFEPTISWSLRVVLALNVPLIVIPFYKGFSYEVIWSAFGAYMLSLIDYRGLHYRKIIIQSVTALLVFVSAIVGMFVANSVIWSVFTMFVLGLFMGVIRNWSDYGPSIAVSAGFFFLFGLATPVSFAESIEYGVYLLAGCAWAIFITLMSFPFQPSNPVRRSVAKIWKANTDLLDLIVAKLATNEKVSLTSITEKELAVRNLIDHSRSLFASREHKKTRLKTRHYDQMIELRKTASLFAASLSSMNEALELINLRLAGTVHEISLYKTLSAFAQASASISVVIFTHRGNDLSLARSHVKRCEAGTEIFLRDVKDIETRDQEKQMIRHFTEALLQALYHLQLSIAQIEEKQNIDKSDYLENYKLSFNEFISGLRPTAFAGFFREFFNINSRQLNYALRVAIGLSAGVFIFRFFNIDHGYWIPLTMMIVIQPYYGATLKRGIERIVGTVAGIILGGMIMLLPLPREMYVGILIVDSFCVAYFLRNNYKVGVFFVTIMMVLLMQISQQGSLELIGIRILATLTGALLALVAGYAFWPAWESKRFPLLIQNAIVQNQNYLFSVFAALQKKQDTRDSWHRARRLAEGANNEVFVSAQRTFQEPGHSKQIADRNFALVGVSIRISREITSIGLRADKLKNQLAFGLFEEFCPRIQNIFEALGTIASGQTTSEPSEDFALAKCCLNDNGFDQTDDLRFIRAELEKIVFELEAMLILLLRKATQ